MQNKEMFLKVVVLLCFSLPVSGLAKGWSLNVGYNNPPGATLGLSFMHLWQDWAFELGAGSAKVKDQNNSSSEVTVLSGDVDFKYLFGSGGFRPYAQVGTFYSTTSGSNTAGLSVGNSTYGGLGFFGMGSSVYGYSSYNFGSGTGYFQFGLGFNL